MKSPNDTKARPATQKNAATPQKEQSLTDELPRTTSRIVIECDRADYSVSRIARAVEDTDVHIVSLVMTPDTQRYGIVRVDMVIDTPAATPVVRSLERYGYDVTAADMPRTDDTMPDTDTARMRALEVLRILEV